MSSKALFQAYYVIEWRWRTVPMSSILGILPSPARNFEAAHVLCARTNFPKSVAENVRGGACHMTHTCTLASLFHSSFSECQEVFLPRFCATEQASSTLRNTPYVGIKYLTLNEQLKGTWGGGGILMSTKDQKHDRLSVIVNWNSKYLDNQSHFSFYSTSTLKKH